MTACLQKLGETHTTLTEVSLDDSELTQKSDCTLVLHEKKKKKAEASLQLKCTLEAWRKFRNVKSAYVYAFTQSRFRSATNVSGIPSTPAAGRVSSAGRAKVKGVKKKKKNAGAVSFTADIAGMPAFRCEGLSLESAPSMHPF